MILLPKFKCCRVFIRTFQLTESNAFSKSIDSSIPGIFSEEVKKEMSSISLIFCPMYLPSR